MLKSSRRVSRNALIAVFIGLITGLAAVIFVGLQIIAPNRPLLAGVEFTRVTITPNADGVDDVTLIRYTLNRTADVTIAFSNKATGQRFLFRDNAARIPNSYEVAFSGVVDGYLLPGEQVDGEIERRLMPDGDYTWMIIAQSEGGERAEQSGEFVIAQGDGALPLIQAFSVTPEIFTPNQDGYDDRVSINTFLAKAAALNVYLEGADGVRFPVPERFEGRQPGEPGAHYFDYDGGVDQKVPPPPDGTYTVFAIAQDKVGQRIRQARQVTIRDGGLPNAEIVAQATGRTVTWETQAWDETYFTDRGRDGRKVAPPSGAQSKVVTLTLPIGDMVLFRMTVRNYGSTPIRTIGPWPGTVYSYEQTKDAIMPPDSRQSPTGAWRVGIECERSQTSLPYRWAIGTPDDLVSVQREQETLYYLMPGQSTTVWGAIRMTELIRTANPQKCYAALIHEGVEIPPLQRRVGEIAIELSPGQAPANP
jgi:hypothetical protein